MTTPNNADRSALAVDLIRHRRDAVNAERSAHARTNIHRTIQSLRPNHAIACIAGQELTSPQRRNIATMNAPTAPAPSTSTPPADAAGKIAQIASILGVSANDPDAIVASILTLFGEPSPADEAARAKLSARELAMCAQKKLSPAAYVASRNGLRGNGGR